MDMLGQNWDDMTLAQKSKYSSSKTLSKEAKYFSSKKLSEMEEESSKQSLRDMERFSSNQSQSKKKGWFKNLFSFKKHKQRTKAQNTVDEPRITHAKPDIPSPGQQVTQEERARRPRRVPKPNTFQG